MKILFKIEQKKKRSDGDVPQVQTAKNMIIGRFLRWGSQQNIRT